MNIPWQKPSEFRAAVDSLARLDMNSGRDLDPVRAFAVEINGLIRRMSGDLDRICRITCPGCRNNCCERATIFYDFKDLLYLYFGPDDLPHRQIYREAGRCIHLGDRGCVLPRDRRPFVCTWYFCPAQKQDPGFGRLNGIVREIKALREDMEDGFCRITSG